MRPACYPPHVLELRRILGAPRPGWHGDFRHPIAVDAAGRHLLSASSDGQVTLWDVDRAHPKSSWQEEQPLVHALAISPDATLAVSAGEDAVVRLRELPGGGLLRRWAAHRLPVLAAAFSPQGDRIVTTGKDKLFHVWDPSAEAPRATWDDDFERHSDWIWDVAFDPEGARLISASSDRTLCVWDVPTGQRLYYLDATRGAALAVAWHSSGLALVAGAEGVLRLWDVAARRPLGAWEGHRDFVSGVAFTPDAKRAVSASPNEGTVRLWEVASGRALSVLRLPGQPPPSPSRLVALGDRVLVGNLDSTIAVLTVT